MKKKRKMTGEAANGPGKRAVKKDGRKGHRILMATVSVLTAAAMLGGCAAQYSAAQYRAMYRAAQYRAAQYSAAYRAAPYSTAWCGSEKPGIPAASTAPGFTEEEYQKLEALRLDGYEDMSISAYRNAVAELTDSAEYMDLLDRFSASRTFDAVKDSDETASFYFYILEPLTAERYRTRNFGGYVQSSESPDADRAVLEFFITLTILDSDKLTVGEYDAARIGVTDGMQGLLEGRQDSQLAEEAFMRGAIDHEITRLTAEWGSSALRISVDYVYMPLAVYDGYRGDSQEGQEIWQNDPEGGEFQQDQERREYPNGTKKDYDSLFVLMTPGYENMLLSDFNRKLLDWANEDYERAERIGGDAGYYDFEVPLTREERHFVTVSAYYSHMENAKMIQSHYTGREEEDPYVNQDLGYQQLEECGRGAYCGLWYQFSWHIDDRSKMTVGERDRCIEGMTSEIRLFWNETGIRTLLTMEEEDVTQILREIADQNSTEQLTLSIEAVSYEKNDERWETEEAGSREAEAHMQDSLAAYDSLAVYRTDGYEDKTVAEFNAMLASDDDQLGQALEAYALAAVSDSDENAEFFHVTLRASLGELYGERFDEPAFFAIYPVKKERPYVDLDGDIMYEFYFSAYVALEYRIHDPERITVGQRDRVLTAICEELQNYVEELSESELMETDMKRALERKVTELIRKFAPEEMEISFEVVDAEAFDG